MSHPELVEGRTAFVQQTQRDNLPSSDKLPFQHLRIFAQLVSRRNCAAPGPQQPEAFASGCSPHLGERENFNTGLPIGDLGASALTAIA
jgi:hypothetical protein